MRSLIVPLSFLACAVSHAESPITPSDLKIIEKSMSQIEQSGNPTPCNHDLSQDTKPTCSSLTDKICDDLWSEKNQGQLKLKTGEVQLGETGESGISATYRANLTALLENESRLPADLRTQASNVLAELKRVMRAENNSKEWFRELSRAEDEWTNVVQDVAEKRAETAMPALKTIRGSDQKIDQKGIYSGKLFELNDEILRAKYEKSENWKRVQKIFNEAKSDVLATLQNLNISDDLKKVMSDRIQTVQLSLPLQDPRLLGADPSCGTTDRNAYYSPTYHTFTVCAGYFNAYQNEANLYATIAHEISHSIDPVVISKLEFEKTPIAQVIKKLYNFKTPPYSCDEWKQISEKLFNPLDKITPFVHPYQTLTDCLIKSENKLSSFDAQAIHSIAKKKAGQDADDYARASSFLRLAQPVVHKEGKAVVNEFYMRPDNLKTASNSYIPLTKFNASNITPEIFVQTLACQKKTVGSKIVTFENAAPEQRKEMFQTAIETAKRAKQAALETKFSICGRECAELVDEGLSRNAQESFADWMATQALPRFLKRQPDLSKRREQAGLAPVDLCSVPGPETEAPDLAAVQKLFSYESHPDRRLRRLSIFTPEVAEAVDCRLDDEIKKGFSSCHF